jgi:uncharacterized protein YjbI with pentapeptide repeats
LEYNYFGTIKQSNKAGGKQMANQEQLDVLEQGVEAWNQWRQEQGAIYPDLSDAILSDAILSDAILSGANLSSADLSSADLSDADLGGANLSGANLSGANLSSANLSFADLSDANLGGANLTDADLSGANLSSADLSGADLSDARVGWTVFGNVDLSVVKGLETAVHEGPSTIGIDTIYASHGDIPEAFLKGAGVDDTFITYVRSLVGKPIEYYSCFISYSSKDEAFARRLYADLQSNNVRCWFAPEDLKIGERIRSGIDEAIRLHDKLLLILSRHSVASGWVEREVKSALAKERKEKRTVLFPVRVDNAVQECPYAWATEIRHERNMGDFIGWKKNHDTYQKAFTRLLRDLKAEAKQAEEP